MPKVHANTSSKQQARQQVRAKQDIITKLVMSMQEPDVEIEYVSAPQDFDSLTLDEPAAAAAPSEQSAPAQPDVPEQPAAPMEDPDSPSPLDRQASGEMDDDADGLTGGLGSHAGIGAGLGATTGLGMPAASTSDTDEAATTSGTGGIPAWVKGGIGFARASDQLPRQVSEAERVQARLDLQRVMAHFTSAEELTGTAPAQDADEQGEDANVTSKKVGNSSAPPVGVGGMTLGREGVGHLLLLHCVSSHGAPQ